MLAIIGLFSILAVLPCSAKVTYFNLENIYGPYCNPQNTYTPDAGVVRYAGTPWTGKCELNLRSCCLPVLTNSSQRSSLSISTRFYIYLQKPPSCGTENVTIQSESGETINIDCHTINGSEYFLDTEKLTIVYQRTEKFPLSKFSMVVTPLKLKTRMFGSCGFDCFSDTYCIDRSLVCDRYRNCPNHVDEGHCDYHNQRKPLSFRAKVILLIVLSLMISFDVFSIIICYFCCGISSRNRLGLSSKTRKSNHATLEEGGASITPLLQSTAAKANNQSH